MSRLVRMLILTLVAVWLPVTLHCRLEAAGFHEADDCCATEQTADLAGDCEDSVCPALEDALYKESSPDLNVAAPAATACFTCLAILAPDRAVAEPVLSPERHAPPPELRVTWQFVARAAPPARAPSLNS